MKLIIDIPEREYKVICENNYVAVCACPNLLSNAIKNGTPISNKTTNGDVVKSIFTNTLDNFCERTTWEWNRWWDEPYQKGGTNEKQV